MKGMKGFPADIARIACAVGLVCALAGLAEGFVLAVVYDPFEAGWAGRLLSIATFVIAYACAGLLAGFTLGVPVLAAARAAGLSKSVAASAVCAVLGWAYVSAWSRSIEGLPVRFLYLVAGAAAFGLTGLLAGRSVRSLTFRGSAAMAGMISVAALICIAASPGDAPRAGAEVRAEVPAADGSPSAEPERRNVLLVVADTLRADHLSLYGYERETSPSLEALARGGTTFTGAIVQKTKTSPSIASVFTGTYPHTHGIVDCHTPLADEAATLAESLRAAGYSTHSIVANSNVGASFNFDQGFESVDEIWADTDASALGVTDHALEWLDRHEEENRNSPFFLYVHYIDPHAPYSPPAPYRDRFVGDPHYGRYAHIDVAAGDESVGSIRPSVILPERPHEVDFYVARYDAEIAFMDHHLSRLFRWLDERDLAGETLVVFTSDHGEALSEHDIFFGHGLTAYEDSARVPLVIRLPGIVPAGATVDRVVEVGGLAPTLLDALGLDTPAAMEIPSFWHLATGRAAPNAAPESAAAHVEGGTVPDKLSTAIRTERWKMIENPEGFDTLAGRYGLSTVLNMSSKQKVIDLARTGRQSLKRYELYDVAIDPLETENLEARERDILEDLRARLAAWRDRGAGRPRLEPLPKGELPGDVIENLKSLGYVN